MFRFFTVSFYGFFIKALENIVEASGKLALLDKMLHKLKVRGMGASVSDRRQWSASMGPCPHSMGMQLTGCLPCLHCCL